MPFPGVAPPRRLALFSAFLPFWPFSSLLSVLCRTLGLSCGDSMATRFNPNSFPASFLDRQREKRQAPKPHTTPAVGRWKWGKPVLAGHRLSHRCMRPPRLRLQHPVPALRLTIKLWRPRPQRSLGHGLPHRVSVKPSAAQSRAPAPPSFRQAFRCRRNAFPLRTRNLCPTDTLNFRVCTGPLFLQPLQKTYRTKNLLRRRASKNPPFGTTCPHFLNRSPAPLSSRQALLYEEY